METEKSLAELLKNEGTSILNERKKAQNENSNSFVQKLQLLLTDKRFNDAIQQANGKEIVLFLGDTGVGKSTIINYLKGVKFKKEINSDGKAIAVPQSTQVYAEIDKEGSYESCTVYAGLYSDEQEQLLYCDTPGFEDTRGIEHKVCASMSLQLAVRAASRIKAIVIVLNYESITSEKGQNLVFIAEKISKLLPNPEKATDSIVFVINKAPKDFNILALAASKKDSLIRNLKSLFELNTINPNSNNHNEGEQKTVVLLELMTKNPKRVVNFDPFDSGESREILLNKLKESKPKRPNILFKFNDYDGSRKNFDMVIDSVAHKGAELIRSTISLKKNITEELILIENSSAQISPLEKGIEKADTQINLLLQGKPLSLEAVRALQDSRIVQLNIHVSEKEKEIERLKDRITYLRKEKTKLKNEIKDIDSNTEVVWKDTVEEDRLPIVGKFMWTSRTFIYPRKIAFSSYDYEPKDNKKMRILVVDKDNGIFSCIYTSDYGENGKASVKITAQKIKIQKYIDRKNEASKKIEQNKQEIASCENVIKKLEDEIINYNEIIKDIKAKPATLSYFQQLKSEFQEKKLELSNKITQTQNKIENLNQELTSKELDINSKLLSFNLVHNISLILGTDDESILGSFVTLYEGYFGAAQNEGELFSTKVKKIKQILAQAKNKLLLPGNQIIKIVFSPSLASQFCEALSTISLKPLRGPFAEEADSYVELEAKIYYLLDPDSFFIQLSHEIQTNIFNEETCIARLEQIQLTSFVNAQDENGNTLLHHVLAKNAKKLAIYLINKGVSINLKNSSGKTALAIAIENNAYEIIKLVFENQKFDLHEHTDDSNNNLLHQIIKHNVERLQISDEELIDFILKKEIKFHQLANHEGHTPVILAAHLSKHTLIHEILDNHILILSRSDKVQLLGRIIFHMQDIKSVEWKILRKLLITENQPRNKQKLLVENYLEKSLLSYVLSRGNKDLVKSLLKEFIDKDIEMDLPLLVEMMSFDQEPGYEWLFGRCKCDKKLINTPLTDGQTVLGRAIEIKNQKLVEFLLQKGADPKRKTHTSMSSHAISPVRLAIELGDIKIVKLLFKNDDLNLTEIEENGMTLFHLAMSLGCGEILAYLWKQFCKRESPEIQNEFLLKLDNAHNNLLHYFACQNNQECTDWLLELRKSNSSICEEMLNRKNSAGEMPLHLAVKNKNTQGIRILSTSKGSAFWSKNHNDETALSLSKSLGLDKGIRDELKQKYLNDFLLTLSNMLLAYSKNINQEKLLITNWISRIKNYVRSDQHENSKKMRKLIISNYSKLEARNEIIKHIVEKTLSVINQKLHTVEAQATFKQDFIDGDYSKYDIEINTIFNDISKQILELKPEQHSIANLDNTDFDFSKDHISKLKKEAFNSSFIDGLQYLYYVSYAMLNNQAQPTPDAFDNALGWFQTFSPAVSSVIGIGSEMQRSLVFSMANIICLVIKNIKAEHAKTAANRIVSAFREATNFRAINADLADALGEAFYLRFQDQIECMSVSISSRGKLRLNDNDGIVTFARAIVQRIGVHIMQDQDKTISSSNVQLIRLIATKFKDINNYLRQSVGDPQKIKTDQPIPIFQRCLMASWKQQNTELNTLIELDIKKEGSYITWLVGDVLDHTGIRVITTTDSNTPSYKTYCLKGFFKENIGFCYSTEEEAQLRGFQPIAEALTSFEPPIEKSGCSLM